MSADEPLDTSASISVLGGESIPMDDAKVHVLVTERAALITLILMSEDGDVLYGLTEVLPRPPADAMHPGDHLVPSMDTIRSVIIELVDRSRAALAGDA